jgi:hypothetical protein
MSEEVSYKNYKKFRKRVVSDVQNGNKNPPDIAAPKSKPTPTPKPKPTPTPKPRNKK